jgi:hypothetical protein
VHYRVNKSPPPDHILSHLGPLHTQHLSGFSSHATKVHALWQGCTNPGSQITMATTFCTAAPNICGSPVQNLLRVTLLAARMLRWFLELGKNCAPLPYVAFHNVIVLAIRNCDQNWLWIIAEDEEKSSHMLHWDHKRHVTISLKAIAFSPLT